MNVGSLVGKRFGCWVVENFSGSNKHKNKLWQCLCDCGTVAVVQQGALRNGKSTNCGCKKSFQLEGKRFGRLNVLKRVGHYQRQQVIWECQCDCGNKTNVKASCLVSGYTKSCGCLSAELASIRNSSHRMSKNSIYHIWKGMRQRCLNPNSNIYKYYGALGVTICDRWDRFESFYEDMGNPPSDKHSIDRIDPYGNYEPSNCRWATPIEQARNKRSANDGSKKIREGTGK